MALILSKFIIYLCIFICSNYMRSSFAVDFNMGSLSFYIQLTQANVGDFTMADNAVFPLVLMAVSFGFAVLSIYNVESKDLL